MVTTLTSQGWRRLDSHGPNVDCACCVLLGIRLLLPLAGGPGAQPVAVGEVSTAPRDHLLRVATVTRLEEARGLSLHDAQFPLTAELSAAPGRLAGDLLGPCWGLCQGPWRACLDRQVIPGYLWGIPLASAPSGSW